MRPLLKFPTAALAGALTLACDNPQGITLADPALPVAHAVDRGTAAFAFVIVDPASGLTVQVGTTFENMVSSCPGLIPPTDVYEAFTVTRPDGSVKVTLSGEVTVLVWQEAANPCDLLNTPHLTGTAKFSAPDSDFDLSGHGADATGTRLVGTLIDESGQKWHLVVTTQFTVAPGATLDDFVLVPHAQHIQITPIGR